jgi:aspartate-semialdehyde dehydrogenase
MHHYKVGILGATGAVGQKFIHLLQDHPWFRVAALGASERSVGKSYTEAANWIEPTLVPDAIAGMPVVDCTPEAMKGVDFVFSGLDSGVATEIESAFAGAGIPVISNAKNFRDHPKVPLLVPEVNPDHIAMIDAQNFDPSGKGFIVTNPNCVVVPLVMALRPIHDEFGVDQIMVTSLQSVSGAGYPGVASLDILGNVIPYINGEEEKIAWEPRKLLGRLESDGSVLEADLSIHATATRVPTIEGHLLAVTLKLDRQVRDAQEIAALLRSWKSPLEGMDLPFAPQHPLWVYDDPRYPQPRKHAYAEKGMQAGVGRIRKANIWDISFVVLAHNTVRGAAGGAILNAELLVKKGRL